jgi:hypothetical protein
MFSSLTLMMRQHKMTVKRLILTGYEVYFKSLYEFKGK